MKTVTSSLRSSLSKSPQARFRHRAALAALATMIAVPMLRADDDWNVSGGGGWGNSLNWLGGTIPNGIDVTANFLFDITAASTVTLDGSRILGTMNVGDPTATNFGYTFSANGCGGVLIFDTSSGNANLTFTAASAGAANAFNVPLQLNDTLNVHALNTGTNAFNGNISGAGGLIFDAGGTHSGVTVNTIGQAILTGFNTFTGGLTVAETRVQAASPFTLGAGTVTVNDGGQIYLSGAGFYGNNFVLNSLGWNESTHGPLGALRSDGNSTLTGSITLAGASRLSGTGGTTLVNGVIGGAGQNLEINRLLLGGAAANSTWVFKNTNTYTGKTTVYSGTLRIGDGLAVGSLGGTSALEFADANIEFRRSDNVTVTTPFTQLTGTIGGVVVTGSNFTHSGIGVLTLDNGSSGYLGTTTVNGVNALGSAGKLVIGSGGLYPFAGAGNVTLTNGADLEFNTSSAIEIGGGAKPATQALVGASNAYLIQSGTGSITLGGTGDNGNARAIVNSGTLILNKTGVNTVKAIASTNELALILNGGTVQIAGDQGNQIHIDSDVQINSGVLDLNGRPEGFDVLTGNGGFVWNTSVAPATLILGESNSTVNVASPIAYNATYGGVITNNTGTVSVTKAGTGIQTLSGANAYTGTTTINGGVLAVTGSLATTGAVAVNAGGTLSGTGMVGDVMMAAGTTSFLRPGATNLDTAVGTLTLNSLTVNGGDIRLNLGGTNDLINVTGATTFIGGTLTPTFSALPVVGTTALINSGALVGAPLLVVPATTRSTFALGVSGSVLNLDVTGTSAKALNWTGATSGAWALSAPANFDAGGAEAFFNLDSATFGDGPVNRVVTLAAGLVPTAVTVNSSVGNDYTFLTGSLAGGGNSLTKSGNGTLFVATANTFSGPTTITGTPTGGMLRAFNGAALGDASGQTFVSGDGTLDINGQNFGAEVINIAGAGVGGNGALFNSGGQQINAARFVTLTGDATIGGYETGRFDIRANGGGEYLDLAGFTLTKKTGNYVAIVNANVTPGFIEIDKGTLAFSVATIVRGAGAILVKSGAALEIGFGTTATNITRPIVLAGGSITSPSGTNGANSNITLSANSTIDTITALTLGGNIGESGGPRILTKTGASTLTLNGSNTFTGGLTLTGGTVNLGGTNSIAGPINLTTSTLQVLSSATVAATLGTPSAISLFTSTLQLNLLNDYTLPAVTVSSINTSNIVFSGQTQASTLTVNSTIGNTVFYNGFFIDQGTVNLASGANLTQNIVAVGRTLSTSGNLGTLNVQPGAMVTTFNMYIGEGAGGRSGIVNQTGGIVNVTGFDNGVDGALRIGHWSGSASSYNLSAGTLNVPTANSTIGVDGVNASFNISGGTANLYRLIVDGRNNNTQPIGGTLNLSGGELAIGLGTLSNGGAGQINLSGGKLSASARTTWSSGMNFVNNTPTLDTRGNFVTGSGALYGTGGFTKAGTGVLVLTNNTSNLAGTINVTEGTVYLTGTLNSDLTTVRVNAGGTLALDGLAGVGRIAGTVHVNGGFFGGSGDGLTTGLAATVALDAGEVLPGLGGGVSSNIGTLAGGSMVVTGGITRFDLNAGNTTPGAGINDLISVTNGLTFSGGSVIPMFSALPTSGNVYTLYTSTGLTGLPTVPANSAVSRLTYGVAANGNNVELTVTGTAKALTWTGGGGIWDLNATPNWDAGTEKFFQADSVSFAGAAPGTITLVGALQPSAITVSGAADYTFSGAGSIDAGALTKSGTGTLTLATANNLSGGTTLNDGVIAFVAGGLGNVGTIAMNGGTFRWQGANTEDISNRLVMSGATTKTFDTNGNDVTFGTGIGPSTGCALVKAGIGTLVLSGNSTYTGTTLITGGTLQMGFGGATGTLGSNPVRSGPVRIDSGAKLSLFRSGTGITFANNVSGSGTWELKGDGAYLNGAYDNINGINSAFTGDISISNARMLLNTPNDIGTGPVTLTSGGQVLLTAGIYSNALSMTGIGWAESASPGNLGAIRFGTATTNVGATWAGPVTVSGDTLVRAHSAGELGTISGAMGGTGRLTFNGAGTIQILGAASNTYVGTTVIDGGGTTGVVTLGKTGGAFAISGPVQMGGFNGNQPNLRMAADNQFAPGVVVTLVNNSGNWTRFDLQGTNQTLAGIQCVTGGGIFQNERLGAGGTFAPATLTINNSADFFFSGYIRDRDGGAGTYPINFVKTGAGTQTIFGANVAYTGLTTVTGGTLKLTDTTAFASPIANSGAVEFNTVNSYNLGGNVYLSGAGTWNKTGIGTLQFNGAQAITASGQINIQQGRFQNNNNAVNWSNSTASLNVSSGANFDLYADPVFVDKLEGLGTVTNTFGNATNQSGTSANTERLTVGVNGGSSSFGGTITDAGIAAAGANNGLLELRKVGAGTFTLTGTNSYHGITAINGGTLLLDYATNATVLNSATAPSLGGGILKVQGGAGTTAQALGTLTLNGGGITVANTGAATTLTLASLNRTAGGTINVDLAAGAGANALAFANTTGIPIAGTLIGWASVTDATATGFGTLSGNNLVRFTGATTVLSATNSVAGTTTTDFTTTGSLTLDPVAHATNSLQIDSTGIATLDLGAQTMSFTSSGLLMTGTGAYTIANGQLGATAAELIINQTEASTLTVSGTISAGAGSLGKGGPGTLILTGANTYTGVTNIAGTLQIGDGTTVGVLGTGAVNNSGTLVYNRSNAANWANAISGSGSLLKKGADVLTLSSASSYSGGTTISAGTVVWGNVSALGTGRITLNDATTGGSTTALLSSLTGVTITNNITVSNQGTGTTIIGTNGGAGNFTAYGGVITLAKDVTLQGKSADRTTFTGKITGTGNIIVDGGGTLDGRVTLDNNFNDFVGNVTVNAAALLQINGTSVIPDASNVTVNGKLYFNSARETINGLNGSGLVQVHPSVTFNPSTLVIGGAGGSGAFSGIIQNGGSGVTSSVALVKTGVGTQTLSGNNLFTGTTTIAAGVLNATSSTALGNESATNTLIFAGGTLQAGGAITSPSTRTVTLASTAIIDTGFNSVSIVGTMSGIGGLTKNGPGILTLTGPGTTPTSNNSFTGDITVNGGKLIGAAVRTGLNAVFGLATNARTFTVNSGATLEFDVPNTFGNHNNTAVPSLVINSGTVTNADPSVSNAVNNALNNVTLNNGTLTSTTGSAAVVTGAETYGAWNINGAVTSSGLSFISTTATSDGHVMLASVGAFPATVFSVQNGILTVSTPLIDGDVANPHSGLTKTGNGCLLLSADNTYSGATNVDAGHLRVTGTLTGSDVIVNVDATLNFEVSQTLPSLTIHDGAVVTLGTVPMCPPTAFAGTALEAFDVGAGVAANAEAEFNASAGLATNAGQAVPEPGSLSLLLAGALGFLARRRRPQP